MLTIEEKFLKTSMRKFFERIYYTNHNKMVLLDLGTPSLVPFDFVKSLISFIQKRQITP